MFSLREDDKMERRLQGDVENKVGANGFSAWRYSTFEFFSRVYVQVYDVVDSVDSHVSLPYSVLTETPC